MTKFMHAMRQLQKAVNRKEKDVSLPKRDFETSKKDLEEAVNQVKNKFFKNLPPATGKAEAVQGYNNKSISSRPAGAAREASGFRQTQQKTVGAGTQRP